MNTTEAFVVALVLFAAAIWAAFALPWITAVVLLAMGWAVVAIAVRALMRGDAE